MKAGYSGWMNTLLNLPKDITHSRGLTLILTSNKARESITELIARFILCGSLFVVAASDWLPASALPRIVRGHTVDMKGTTNRLRTARTSTCFRLLDSLANIPLNGEPILVLDLLHTLYDPNLHLPVRFRVLKQCCRHLERLAFYRPVIVMTQEMQVEEYDKFLPILRSIADKTLYLDPEPEQASQPTLL